MRRRAAVRAVLAAWAACINARPCRTLQRALHQATGPAGSPQPSLCCLSSEIVRQLAMPGRYDMGVGGLRGKSTCAWSRNSRLRRAWRWRQGSKRRAMV